MSAPWLKIVPNLIYFSRCNLERKSLDTNQCYLTSVLKISGRTAGRRGPQWGCKWSAWTFRCLMRWPGRTASRCGLGAPLKTHTWQGSKNIACQSLTERWLRRYLLNWGSFSGIKVRCEIWCLERKCARQMLKKRKKNSWELLERENRKGF